MDLTEAVDAKWKEKEDLAAKDVEEETADPAEGASEEVEAGLDPKEETLRSEEVESSEGGEAEDEEGETEMVESQEIRKHSRTNLTRR